MGSSCLILNVSITVDNITLVPQMFFFPAFLSQMKECPFKNSFYTLFSQATARHNQTNLQHTTESIHIFFFLVTLKWWSLDHSE